MIKLDTTCFGVTHGWIKMAGRGQLEHWVWGGCRIAVKNHDVQFLHILSAALSALAVAVTSSVCQLQIYIMLPWKSEYKHDVDCVR